MKWTTKQLTLCGVLTALAGRVYRLMSLYKGNPPTPRRVLRMLRER